MMRVLIVAMLTVAAPGALRAGEIVGFNSETRVLYDRFVSGFPAAPVANTSTEFVGAGLDLSGVGWRAAGNWGVTLVSPQHIVTAAHVGGYSPTDQVRFLSNDGSVRSYAVALNDNGTVRQTRLTTTFTDPVSGLTRTLPSDILVVTLATPISASDGVNAVPVGVGTAPAGTDLLAYAQNPAYGADTRQIGTNTLDAITLASFNQLADEATRVALFDFTRNRPGEVALIGGDSGGALLTRQGDTAILLGTHYGVSGNLSDPNSTYLSASTYLPDYLDQLAAVVAADGQSLSVVPVPEPVGILAVGLLFGTVRRLRNRRSTRPS